MGNALKRIAACTSSVSLIVCTIPVASFADAAAVGTTFESAGITYTVISPTEASVGAQKSSGAHFASSVANVDIPATVNGYSVTGINDYAFSNGADNGAQLKTLTLPKTITTIGKYAFEGCSSLVSVSIPASVSEIGMYAFANCPALESLSFDDPESTVTPLAMGEGTFFGSSKTGGAIKELLLPKRLRYVPTKAFQNQSSLTKVRYAPGTALSRIDSFAFNGCKSLKSLEIPVLTAKTESLPGSAWRGDTPVYAIGSDAFSYCDALEELIFRGDEDYNLSESSFVTYYRPNQGLGSAYTTYSNIKTIVYYGSHASSIFDGSVERASVANHYQKIDYFDNASAANAGGEPKGCVFTRDDVQLKDIVNSIGKTDAKGALVYNGEPPSLPEGKSWYYVGKGFGDCATEHCKAYPVDTSDLRYGSVVLEHSSLTYTGKPLKVSFTVHDVKGTSLSSGSEYILRVTDADGRETSLDNVKDKGTYTLTASGTPGSTYTGSVSTTLAVEEPCGQITRLDGNAAYGTKNHALDVAFAAEDTDTVVLVGQSAKAAGAAAAGLAGASGSPIVVTADKSLSLEARRNLNVLKPSSVLLVGIKDAETVTKAVKDVLGSTVSVSNAFTAKTDALSSYAMYNRTKASGYWNDARSAFAASAADAAAAALAGSWAYRMGCPVFLTSANGKLPAESAKAIAADGFDKVVFIGLAADKLSAAEAQTEQAGFTGAAEQVSANDIYELSAVCAKEQMAAGCASLESFMIASPQDTKSMATAAAVSGKAQSALLLADDSEAGKAAVKELIELNRYEVSEGYVFGTRSYLSGAFQDELQRLWASADSNVDLVFGRIALSGASFTYNGKRHIPTAIVKAKDGKTLVEGNDYAIDYYDDATDRRVLASEVKGAGSYTVVATGKGAYTGSVSSSFSISKAKQRFTVKASKKSFRKSALKAKAQSLTLSAKAQGKVTYKVTTGAKYLKVNAQGKAVLKKGAPKGTYEVQARAAANANYLASAPVTIKVVVK